MATETDEAAIKRRRAIILVAAFVLIGFLGWNFRPKIEMHIDTDRKALVGCYRGGDTMVRLSDQGFLHTIDGNWPYEVDRDAKANDARLLVVDEIAAGPDGAGLKFTRAPRGQGLRTPVEPNVGFRWGSVPFAKVPCQGTKPRHA